MGRIQIKNFFNSNLIFLNIILLIVLDNYTIINNYIYLLTTQCVDYIKGCSFVDFFFIYNNLLFLNILTTLYVLLLLLFAFTSKLKNLKRYTSYLKIIILNKCYNIYLELLSSDKKYISLNKIFNNYNLKNIFFITVLFIYFFSLIQYKEIIENQELITFSNILLKEDFQVILNIDNFSIIYNILVNIFYILIILHIIVALYSIFFDYCTIYINYTFTITLILIIMILDLLLAYCLFKNCLNCSFLSNILITLINTPSKMLNVDLLFYDTLVNKDIYLNKSNLSKLKELDPIFKFYEFQC